jgi:5-methylcytosine-specific restriction endonuclease McrA
MPMERDRYPANWRLMALAIKQAAAWNCQQCGRPCRQVGETITEFEKRLDGQWLPELAELVTFTGQEAVKRYRVQRFLLTVAHLDQDPGNNKPENLMALCAPCHLRYDRQFLTYNQMARLEREGQLNLLTVAGGGF